MDLVKPIRTAGIPVHLALGNHDDRDNFHKAIALAKPKQKTKEEKSPVADKVVSVLETPLANWFLLDSLKTTMVTPACWQGTARLARQGTGRPSQEAGDCAGHHYFFLPGGLDDSDALLEVLVPRSRSRLTSSATATPGRHPLARHPLAQFAGGRLGVRQIAAPAGRSEADRRRARPCSMLGQEASEKRRAAGMKWRSERKG